MKKTLLAVVLPSLIFAGSATAASIYNSALPSSDL